MRSYFFFSLSQLNWVVTGAKNHNWIICLAEQLYLYSTTCQVSFELFWWLLPFTCLFREIYNLQPKEVAAIPSILPLAPTSSQNASHFSHLHQFVAEKAHRHGGKGAGRGLFTRAGSLKASKGVLIHHVPNLVTRNLPLKHKEQLFREWLKEKEIDREDL